MGSSVVVADGHQESGNTLSNAKQRCNADANARKSKCKWNVQTSSKKKNSCTRNSQLCQYCFFFQQLKTTLVCMINCNSMQTTEIKMITKISVSAETERPQQQQSHRKPEELCSLKLYEPRNHALFSISGQCA